MYLIAGLGNPGPQYEKTRHNAGFIAIDKIRLVRGFPERKNEQKWHAHISKGEWQGHKITLVKPQSYMNKSGGPISSIATFFKIPPKDILAIHDEIDFPTGKIKFKEGGSHAGNNGIRDMITRLGTRDFPRIRIGIDKPQNKEDVVKHVLQNFSQGEKTVIESQFPTIQQKIETWISQNSKTSI